MAVTIDSNVWVAAADKSDAFSNTSRRFLAGAAQRNLTVYLPAFAWVEIACAMARRRNDPQAGRRLAGAILNASNVVRVPHDSACMDLAHDVGTDMLLRGADSLYVATAKLRAAQLVSWDDELIRRAGAISPADWLAANP